MSNTLLRTTVVLALSALVTRVAPPAQAQFITTDTTISTYLNTDVYIGQNSDGTINTSPTVNLVPGGTIGGQVFIFNNSTFNIEGGTIANSSVIVGPTSNCVTLNGNCTVNMDSGTVAGGMTAGAGGININGGSVGGSLFAEGSSAFIGNPAGSGAINIRGGAIAGVVGVYGGTVNLTGGSDAGGLFATFFGTFNIYGYNLGESLLASDVYVSAPAYDEFYGNWFYDVYGLSGALEDGTSLAGTDLYVSDFIVPQVNLINVPEPGNAGLLAGLLAVGLYGRQSLIRRKRASRSVVS